MSKLVWVNWIQLVQKINSPTKSLEISAVISPLQPSSSPPHEHEEGLVLSAAPSAAPTTSTRGLDRVHTYFA
jgi:hypothetical protein